jgi:hypothetical protein
LLTLPGHVRRIEVRSESDFEAVIEAISYARQGNARPAAMTSLEARSCPCPAPAVVDRQAWCPTGDCEPRNSGTSLDPSFVIVHHSAGNLTAGIDYALVVRAIYDYHVNTNGWDDIGYNLLIAPDGTVFQGRGTRVQGAHFCSANAEALGVCMLGNFENEQPAIDALSALTSVGYFLSCEFSIDVDAMAFHAPSGKTLRGVSGHRDGCNTQCPGELLYDKIPQLVANIQSRIDAGCMPLEAPDRLTASALSDGAVALRWDAYAGADQIIVERSVSIPTSYESIATIGGSLNSYTDDDAPSGANYYRIRAIVDGELSPYSAETYLAVSSSESGPPVVRPSLAQNPVRGRIEVKGLHAAVDMAFISDAAGRTVLELPGHNPSWSIGSSGLPRGKYWIVIFSGNEWFSVPFEYVP